MSNEKTEKPEAPKCTCPRPYPCPFNPDWRHGCGFCLSCRDYDLNILYCAVHHPPPPRPV